MVRINLGSGEKIRENSGNLKLTGDWSPCETLLISRKLQIKVGSRTILKGEARGFVFVVVIAVSIACFHLRLMSFLISYLNTGY